MSSRKPYYRIKELTGKRWKESGITAEDIIERVDTEGLSLYIFYSSVSLIPDGGNGNDCFFMENLFAKIPESTIKELAYSNYFYVEDTGIIVPGKEGVFLVGYKIDGMFTLTGYKISKIITPIIAEPILINIDNLFLSGSDVEKLDSELANEYSLAESMAKLLDSDHGWYSEPLAVAVKAWIDIYQNRPGNSHDREYKPPNGGHRGEIKTWLGKNAPKLLKPTSLTHFTAILNPDKRGGSAATRGN